MRKLMLIFIITMSVAAFGFVASSNALEVRTQMLVTTEWLTKNLDNPDVVILHVPREYDRCLAHQLRSISGGPAP